MKTETNIHELAIRYFEGHISKSEEKLLFSYIEQAEENRLRFRHVKKMKVATIGQLTSCRRLNAAIVANKYPLPSFQVSLPGMVWASQFFPSPGIQWPLSIVVVSAVILRAKYMPATLCLWVRWAMQRYF